MMLLRYCLLVQVLITWGSTSVQQQFKKYMQEAHQALNSSDFSLTQSKLELAIVLDPKDIDANQLLGTVLVKLQQYTRGASYLREANELTKWKDPHMVANYIESLRAGGDLEAARLVVLKAAFELHPKHSAVLFNSGLVARDMKDFEAASQLLRRAAEVDPRYYSAWDEGTEVMMQNSDYKQAEEFATLAVKQYPNNHRLTFLLGVSKHHQNKLDEALELYHTASKLEPSDAEDGQYSVWSTMGAAYQALGMTDLSEECYLKCLPFKDKDVGIRNNYGALLGTMNRKEEEIKWLQEALDIDPDMEMALTNLGGYYQDEGELQKAQEYLARAVRLTKKGSFLRLRIIMMLSPISSSWAFMIQQRNDLEHALKQYVAALQKNEIPGHELHELDSNLDRIHFYLVYHGVNDRPLQELIVAAYRLHISDLEVYVPSVIRKGPSIDSLQTEIQSIARTQSQSQSQSSSQPQLVRPSIDNSVQLQQSAVSPIPARRVKIAFLSKFFGIFEPHGLLLDGIMRSLPRSQFEVIALPIARTDGKPLSPQIQEAADLVVETSLSHSHVFKMVDLLDLDILVFADTMSEPMTHFLAHSRLATIQVAFWGNPITSASANIDFFVSAECLEHPYRTRMPIASEPYTEQVVLLEGQGIWYNIPEPPEVELKKTNLPLERLGLYTVYDRSHFNLSNDWPLYFCPQSVFKMHPEFDFVFRDLLLANPRGHIVITGGRRQAWTDIYVTRLQKALGPVLYTRLHVIERVSSEKFLALLRIADVILHPFPFDGSRTSADGLIVGVPVITLPAEYLRGRMGAAFFRTMNMPELVARNRSEYVQMAARLGTDKIHLQHVKQKIQERLSLIWEDMEYVHSWYRFLSIVSGVAPMSWEVFVNQTGRDVLKETRLVEQRQANRKAFDRAWGTERWLLGHDGIAHLESHLTPHQVPKIFNDWQSVLLSNTSDSHVQTDGESLDRELRNEVDNVRHPDVRSDAGLMSSTAVGADGTSGGDGGVSNDGLSRSTHINVNVNVIEKVLEKSSSDNVGDGISSDKKLQSSGDDNNGNNNDNTNNVNDSDEFKTVSDEEALSTMIALARAGRLDDSYDIAVQLYHSGRYSQDPKFLLDFCGIQFFRGEYESAFHAGKQALALQPDAVLAYECVGVSGLYLAGQEAEALKALTQAWEKETALNIQLRQEGKERNGTSAVGSVPGQLTSYIFTQTTESIEINLLAALRTRGYYDDCVAISASIMDVPLPNYGGGYLMTFAAVNWSTPQAEMALQQLEQRLTALGKLQLAEGRTLAGEIRRMQQSSSIHVLNVALYCLSEVHSLTDATEALWEVISLPELETLLPFPTAEQDHNIVLITQYYRTQETTQRDVDGALVKNLANPHIKEIYLLTEERLDLAALGFAHGATKDQLESIALSSEGHGQLENPSTMNSFGNVVGNGKTIGTHKMEKLGKLHQYVVGERLTFATAFTFANTYLRGKTVVLSNADIFFDDSLARLYGAKLQGNVLALLKWIDGARAGRDEIVLNLRTDSQDAWIFQPPLNASIITQSDFVMGATKCDNRIAEIFAESGHPVSNPAFALHAIEIHTNNRDPSGLYGTKGAPFGPTREVLLSDRHVFR